MGVDRERRDLTIFGVRLRLDRVARDEIAVMLGRQQTGMRQGDLTLGAAVVGHSDPGQGSWGLGEASGGDGDRARCLMDHRDDVVAGEQSGEPVPMRGAEDDQIGLALFSDVCKARGDGERGYSRRMRVAAA